MIKIKLFFLISFLISFKLILAQEPEQDCIHAIPICKQVYTQEDTYSGEGDDNKEINSAFSCLASGERNDVWYTLTVQSDGNLGFHLTSISPTDYDWAVYNLSNAKCSDIRKKANLEVSCNYAKTVGITGPNGTSTFNRQGATGTLGNALIPVKKGEIYVINISNFDGFASGYTLDFSPSDAGIIDLSPPELLSIGLPVICGSDELILNFNENVLCSSIQPSDFNILGGGNLYQVTSVVSTNCVDPENYTRSVKLNISQPFFGGDSISLNLVGKISDICGNLQDTGKILFETNRPFSIVQNHVNNCVGEMLNFSIVTTGNGSPYLYTYYFNNELFVKDTLANAISKSFAVAGFYPVEILIKDKNGCSLYAKDSYQVYENPNGDFTYKQTKVLNYEFQAIGNAEKIFNWDFGDGSFASDSFIVHEYLSAGNYLVKLILENENGCKDTIIKNIVVSKELELDPNTEVYLDVPNAFSPDDNSINSIFKIRHSGLSVFEIKIFNRWGKLLFSSKDPNFYWNSNEISDGIYPYVINGKFINGEAVIKNGIITLSR